MSPDETQSIIQIATQVLPLFDIPAWTLRTIVVAVVLGFPFVLVFAWLYEITPEGLKREKQGPSLAVDRSQHRPQT